MSYTPDRGRQFRDRWRCGGGALGVGAGGRGGNHLLPHTQLLRCITAFFVGLPASALLMKKLRPQRSCPTQKSCKIPEGTERQKAWCFVSRTVMSSSWYSQRHAHRPVSLSALKIGICTKFTVSTAYVEH